MTRLLSWSSRLLLGVLVAVSFVGSASLVGSASASTGAPPYSDPNAQGSIGLCDQAGHPVTSGSVSAVPFVWAAVSSVAPPRGYDGDGRTATLFVYQPRQGVTPGEWSGQLMTSSSRYTNAAHPMTVATAGDSSLADFLSTFPATWSGYLELRLFVGAPDQPQYTLKYPTTDIQVTGDTWRVVRGGGGPCGVGTAQSLESRVLPGNLTNPSTTVTTTSSVPASPLGTNPAKVVGKAPTGEAKHEAQASAVDPHKARAGSTSTVVGVLAVAVVLIGAGAWLFVRRRSRNPVEPPTSEEPR